VTANKNLNIIDLPLSSISSQATLHPRQESKEGQHTKQGDLIGKSISQALLSTTTLDSLHDSAFGTPIACRLLPHLLGQ
jgi:hypothetical protein